MSCGRCHHLSDSSVHVMLMVSSCSGRNEAPTLTQTLCETLSFLFLKNLFSLKRFVQLLFLQNLLLLKHFVKRSVSSSFKTYSHSNILCNTQFPLPPKPTFTQMLCETLSFLFLQNLFSLQVKHSVKRLLPLPSKPTLTQTFCETLTFLFLQILLSLKHFVKRSLSSSFKSYSHSNTL